MKPKQQPQLNNLGQAPVVSFKDYTGKHKTFEEFAKELKGEIGKRKNYVEKLEELENAKG